MVSGARRAAYTSIAFALSCGGASEAAPPDASADSTLSDSTLPDSSTDAFAPDAAPPDATVTDAGTDAPMEASCSNTGTALAKCQSDAGFCFDYVGSGWNSSNIGGCNVEAGAELVWDAACPTTGQVGSCRIGQPPYDFIERCYPPFGPNQCQGFCLIFDGGYCPN